MASADAPAIATLFVEYGDQLVARARRVMGSEADAEDAVQEVMLTLLDAPHLLATVESLGGWLLTMARRRAIDLVRSDARRSAREASDTVEDLFAGVPDPAEWMERDEVAHAVANAVEELPHAQRAAFVANALDGRTFKEISEETGVPMGTLMARKKRAVDHIRGRLRQRGLLPPEERATGPDEEKEP